MKTLILVYLLVSLAGYAQSDVVIVYENDSCVGTSTKIGLLYLEHNINDSLVLILPDTTITNYFKTEPSTGFVDILPFYINKSMGKEIVIYKLRGESKRLNFVFDALYDNLSVSFNNRKQWQLSYFNCPLRRIE